MKRANSSMQLTRAADYAVRVMIHLATLPAHERASLPALALATATPESFLSKVLQALSRAKLITSLRGQSGGFEILPTGRHASMRKVIEAIDGPIHLNVCLISQRACGRSKSCPAHQVWAQAQRAMLDVLSGAVIAELASRKAATKSGVDTGSAFAGLWATHDAVHPSDRITIPR
jgi:Rrf2 family protein